MDANFSTMTMPKTMPLQNLLRYISFKWCEIYKEKPKKLFCEKSTLYIKILLDPDFLVGKLDLHIMQNHRRAGMRNILHKMWSKLGMYYEHTMGPKLSEVVV